MRLRVSTVVKWTGMVAKMRKKQRDRTVEFYTIWGPFRGYPDP